MKVLFTGASSFTGLWFIRELARAGHDVVAVFRRDPESYPDALRRERVALALEHCEGVFGCSFGDARFTELASSKKWDVLCHHAADVTNYRSPDFDVIAALENNTRGVAAVVDALKAAGSATRLVVTGSVFEHDEGAGSEGRPAFSPYGLSKGLAYQVFRYHAIRTGLTLGKFVIPNPFGPHEEPRFTGYLMKTWFAGRVAAVNTPAYVRDNIHVSLLARAYARYVAGLTGHGGLSRFNPSGYVESQGAFTLRFAREMRSRLNLACEVELKDQTEFTEPRIRINTDPVDAEHPEWDESAAWDEIARYYEQRLRVPDAG